MKKTLAASLALVLALAVICAVAAPFAAQRARALDMSIGTFSHGEIEDVEVEPLATFSSSLGSYEHGEIEDVEVEPIATFAPIEIEYDHGEIEDVEVEPIATFTPIEIEYEVRDISDVAPELQSFYTDLVGYFHEDQLNALEGLSDLEIADIVQRQRDLIDDLNEAFAQAGIDVNIDQVSGTVPIDATLLYATNEYKVTEAGKAQLARVMGVYCEVLSREKYRDFVSQVVIVGHTDTDGSYDYNLKLSRNRAEAVRDFCLSDECGVVDRDWLASRLVAEGHSYDDLIFNPDGTENKAASRRVEIGFTIAVG